MKLTAHLYLMQKARMSGAILLFPPTCLHCVHTDDLTFICPFILFGLILHLIDDCTTERNSKFLNHKTSAFVPIS